MRYLIETDEMVVDAEECAEMCLASDLMDILIELGIKDLPIWGKANQLLTEED